MYVTRDVERMQHGEVTFFMLLSRGNEKALLTRDVGRTQDK
jgi:hypothetical protein